MVSADNFVWFKSPHGPHAHASINDLWPLDAQTNVSFQVIPAVCSHWGELVAAASWFWLGSALYTPSHWLSNHPCNIIINKVLLGSSQRVAGCRRHYKCVVIHTLKLKWMAWGRMTEVGLGQHPDPCSLTIENYGVSATLVAIVPLGVARIKQMYGATSLICKLRWRSDYF